MGKAVGNVIGEVTGSNQQARAAGRAARAQERAALSQQRFARETQDRAIELADSPQELRALESSLAQQEQAVQRQATLFSALDPAVLEASEQALALLQGEDAKALDPIRRQRQRQRQQLLNTLREQLGPGAETSSAGQKAIQNFDFETSQQLAGAQQSSLGQLFEIGQSGAVNRGQLGQGIGQIASIGQAFGNVAGRKVGALTGTSPFVAQAGQAVVGSAGSRHTESALRGQFMNQFITDRIKAGEQIGAAAIGGAAKGFGAG